MVVHNVRLLLVVAAMTLMLLAIPVLILVVIAIVSILFLLFLFILLFRLIRGGRRIRQLHIAAYHVIREDHSLLRSLDPRCLWLDLDGGHANLLEQLLVELWLDVRLLHRRQAEEQSSLHGSRERNHELGEDRAQSVLGWEWTQISNLFFLALVFWLLATALELCSHLLLQHGDEQLQLIPCITFRALLDA